MKKLLIAFIVFSVIFCAFFSSAISVTFSVPQQYQEVHAGNQVYVQTSIQWPENTVRQDLRVEYSVQDKSGNEIAYLKVLRAIETQASFTDSIPIPQNTKSGTYIIYENISNYGNMSQQAAASFQVIGQQDNANLFNTYIFVVLGIVGLIAILVLIELFVLIKKRNSQ